MFTPSDLAQLDARGISVEKAEKQLQSFATGFPELDIVSAASVGRPSEISALLLRRSSEVHPTIFASR